MIKHKHHIIPKHAGGTNESTNLIELTIEEHADAHRILYEQYGKIEDYYAWKGLSGCIGKDEILKGLAMAQKGKKKPEGFGDKISNFRKTFRYSEDSKRKISQSKKGKLLSDKHKKNISESLKGKKNTDYQKQRVAEIRQKKYVITNSEGKIFEITNLSKFCRENNLDQGNMHKSLVKGWSCKKAL
jgi:hypothetical protein